MFKWLSQKLFQWKLKLFGKYLDDLYEYRIRFLLKDAISLSDNTWDQERIKRIILGLCSIDLERYAKDEEMHKLILNKFRYK